MPNSEEKHEPVGDIDTAAVDSLKTLDPKRPIREATEQRTQFYVGSVPILDIRLLCARQKPRRGTSLIQPQPSRTSKRY